MLKLPSDPADFQSRVWEAVLGDILDPHPNSRLAALRSSMISRDGEILQTKKMPDGSYRVEI